MLAIRLQRVGRKGYAMYRVVVQESQRQPTSGRVVAFVGTYDPHSKDSKIQVEVAQKFLDNGAQPSPRVVKLLVTAGVKMPEWVTKARVNTKVARKSDKLRKNQPKVEVKPVAEPVVEEIADEVVAEIVTEVEEPVVEATDDAAAETTEE